MMVMMMRGGWVIAVRMEIGRGYWRGVGHGGVGGGWWKIFFLF